MKSIRVSDGAYEWLRREATENLRSIKATLDLLIISVKELTEEADDE